jgi:hypothetical protein
MSPEGVSSGVAALCLLFEPDAGRLILLYLLPYGGAKAAQELEEGQRRAGVAVDPPITSFVWAPRAGRRSEQASKAICRTV